MTLPEFFLRCIQKTEDLSSLAKKDETGRAVHRQYEYTGSHLFVLYGMSFLPVNGKGYSKSAIKSSWSYVLQKTKGTDFFEEFEGDLELRKLLADFLAD